MKISDLLVEIEEQFGFKEKPLKCDLIALDGKTGKILFDTSRNKKEYVEKYHDSEISCLWADVRLVRGCGFMDYFRPVMKCYVKHDSWLEESAEG